MKLHENKELFQDAITATSQQKGIPEIYIEKDYWVTIALHAIFNNEIGKETVFKGGTHYQKSVLSLPGWLVKEIKVMICQINSNDEHP